MPDDLIECVARGIDMFDCVLPTRNARNGQLLTSRGTAVDQERAVRRGPGAARSGLRLLHLPALFARVSASLYMSGEMTAATLNSVHNLYFYLDTMRRIREAISVRHV